MLEEVLEVIKILYEMILSQVKIFQKHIVCVYEYADLSTSV